MVEGTALYNQQHYSRLETLITDDAQLMALLPTVESTGRSIIAGDDYVLEMLWAAQMGNADYPFDSTIIPVKHNHCRGCGDKNCRRVDTYGAQAV
jgi:hypothetical protein